MYMLALCCFFGIVSAMLKIRMQRIGRKNDPAYRIVVIEQTRGPKSGNFVEQVGSYNPKTKDLQLNDDRIKYWISVGAQPGGTVHNMLVNKGVIKADKINVLPQKSPVVKESEEKEVEEEKSEESTEEEKEEKEEAVEEKTEEVLKEEKTEE
jgi:small subunit ribosomal protein S16